MLFGISPFFSLKLFFEEMLVIVSIFVISLWFISMSIIKAIHMILVTIRFKESTKHVFKDRFV